MKPAAPAFASPTEQPSASPGAGHVIFSSLPKSPVLGWDSLLPRGDTSLASLSDLPHQAMTTSGRAALLAALLQLQLAPGSGVLVPTYHCPTMVAPVIKAGLQPVFYPIDDDGLPQIDAIDEAAAKSARVIFVAHFFGLPRDLQRVADWAHARQIVLIEDCAHSYFGMAGSRPVGHWGAFATASLSKFFPLPEGGLLASAHHPLLPLALKVPGLRTEIKAVVDIIDWSARHHRLAGPRHFIAPALWLKNRHASPNDGGYLGPPSSADEESMMTACDMARVAQRPARVARLLYLALPTALIVERRRRNFGTWTSMLSNAPGAWPCFPELPDTAAPYVWPLWVDGHDRAEAVYEQVRRARLPVFRWDRIWPGTPSTPDDKGPRWNRHLLQLLCHQDLSDTEVRQAASRLVDLLRRCK